MDKDRLNKAFRQLRKEGFVAKQNFLCCSLCATSEIGLTSPDKPFVYYHQQDTDDLRRLIERNRTPYIYLGWKGDGNKIKTIFESFGIQVEWDGENHTKIKIFP